LTSSVINWPLFGELFINQTASFKQHLQMIVMLRIQLIVTTIMAQTFLSGHQAATQEQFIGEHLIIDWRIIGCPQIKIRVIYSYSTRWCFRGLGFKFKISKE